MVGCAGILVSDTVCGPMAGLPKEGQLLAVEGLPTKSGGCAANVAIDLSKQGIEAEVAGCLGSDSSAQVLLADLQEHGVGTGGIVYSKEFPTSKTVILLVTGQDRRFIHSFGANGAFKVADIDRDWVKSLSVFYLGGLFLMPEFRVEEFLDILALCRENHVTSVVDVVIPQNAPIPQNLSPLLQAADYFLPNDDEAAILTGATDPFEQLGILLDWGASTVAITLGGDGAIVGRGSEYWKAGTYNVCEPVDPSGSGDAFDAGLITGLVQGWDLERTIGYASVLGASANCALGTTDGVYTAEEAEKFIASHKLSISHGTLRANRPQAKT